MKAPDWRREWWALPVCTATALYFVFVWVSNATRTGGAFDIYMHYYPNMVYAARQLWSGGRGLLWNPLQNCGQPFFAESSTALLYPPTWLFFFLSPEVGVLAVTLINLTIGGIGAYALGRELGARPAAAVCGALAFELGNTTIDMSTWSPMVGSPYVWLPGVLWCCERTVRQPSLRNGIALAIILTCALLTGFPQPVLFVYQLVALRVLWELLTRRNVPPLHLLAAIGTGLLLAPLLAAVHLVPSLEMAALSVRGHRLTMPEILGEGPLTIAALREAVGKGGLIQNPITFLPWVLACTSFLAIGARRIALFYAAAGTLFLLLAFGPATPLFGWYLALPANGTFRGPARFTWVVSLCIVPLTALGTDAILRGESSPAALTQRARVLLPIIAATIAMHVFATGGLHPGEWLLALAVMAAPLLNAAKRRYAAALVIAATVSSLAAFYVPSYPELAALRGPGRPLAAQSISLNPAPIFDWLRRNASQQERVYIMESHANFRLMPKTASLFGFRGVHDYDPAPARRWAEYQVMLRTGQPMRNLNSFYYQRAAEPPLRPLLNLAAGRYLLVDGSLKSAPRVASRYNLRWSGRGIALYENPEALPRAFYVPRVEIVPDPNTILQRLSDAQHRPGDVALLESPPEGGFTGENAPSSAASVEFIRDDPEYITLRVHAPQRGFLHLADQHFPGWAATVNGAVAPLLRANFIFRLVEVPAGESLVELRYAPVSLRVGAAISAAAVMLVLSLLWITRQRVPTAGPQSHQDPRVKTVRGS